MAENPSLVVRPQMGRASKEGSGILIVCGGNTCRRPMAEGIAKRLVGSSAHVESAGVDAADGNPPTQEALFVIKELGGEALRGRHPPPLAEPATSPKRRA
jgi:protein-tyrosine-phosphatase